MCRYAVMTYKPHYACFSCRKAFKRRLRADIKRPGNTEHPARCPQCALLMASMGLDFKPPKLDDLAGWELAAKLWEVGLTFHSCGCSGPGYRPRERRAYREFLEHTLAGYLDTLRQHMDAKPTTPKRMEEQQRAVATWQERIARIKTALAEEAR